jgi:glycosyltransferase involved in cell wall biosynthesis
MIREHRLVQVRRQLVTTDVEHIFGKEYALKRPDPSLELAPVRRVAIFAEAFLPKVDGVSKSAYLTVRYLEQTGRKVMVFAPAPAPARVSNTLVVSIFSLGMPFAPETRVGLVSAAVGKYLDEFQPDLIHLFSPALLGVNGLVAGLRRNIPVVANYQTDLPGYTAYYGMTLLNRGARDWLRTIHNRCHLTLVPSNYTQRQLQQWGYRRLRLWERGVDGERFNPRHRSAEWRARLLNGRDPNSLVCVYIGRLASEKRVDLLLNVARTPGVALTIIGDGALREELETQFAGTGTHFTGYLFGQDLSHAFASADVFVFTGPNETFGQVVQEAMASGLPTVVINQGGVADLVKAGETGYTCANDPEAFAAAVRTLRDNPPLRQQMALNARRIAEQRPWEAIMSQLEGHYDEAVDLNRRFSRLYRSPKPARFTVSATPIPELFTRLRSNTHPFEKL